MSNHFDGELFFNPVDHKTKSLMDVLKWKLNSDAKEWPKQVANEKTPQLPTQLNVGEYALTFINHATFLIQIQTKTKMVNILTDPVFSERASPFSFAGPKRVRPPGLAFGNLPPIDLVLVSHNHYDHMDYSLLKHLHQKFAPLFIVPIGNAKYLDFVQSPRVQERDWGEHVELPEWEMKVHVVRAHHWSRRSLLDTNKALWGGFVIQALDKKIYFAGDTGYQNHFSEIKTAFDGVNLAMLPIGAYAPRWFMKDAHMDPSDAIKAHQDLSPIQSVAIHFGTFQLTDEGIDDPVVELEKLKKEKNISNFEVLKVGETRIFSK